MFMRTNKLDVARRATAGVTLLAALLAGCSKPVPPPQDASPSTPRIAAPDAEPPTQAQPAPQDSGPAPAQPSRETAPPGDSAAPSPTVAFEPDFERMQV